MMSQEGHYEKEGKGHVKSSYTVCMNLQLFRNEKSAFLFKRMCTCVSVFVYVCVRVCVYV